MIETGTVIELRDGRAKVRIERGESEACKTCAGGCGSAGRFEIKVSAPEGIEVDDVVKVELALPNAALSALLLFLVPLVLLMAGIGASQWLKLGGQGKGLLIGLGLMVVWYACVAVFDRMLRNRPGSEPRVIEIVRKGSSPAS